jgi:hypothetical protein
LDANRYRCLNYQQMLKDARQDDADITRCNKARNVECGMKAAVR